MQSPSKVAILSLMVASMLMPTASAADDVVLRAMTDELDRSIKNLRIEQKAKPYFIGYRVTDDKRLRLTYELGRKAEEEQQENRVAEIDMHAGDKTFDNTSELVGRGTRDRSRYLPLDDNYDVIRRHFWVLTDDSYKDAGEEYEKQDAYQRGHIIRNLTNSFSDAPSVQSACVTTQRMPASAAARNRRSRVTR